jgi:ribosomal protein S18 acetylase RimI-like enzyme
VGGGLQERFFEEFLNDCPELFLVAEVDGEIVGYCLGYYMDKDDQMSNFIRKNRWSLVAKTIFLMLIGNRPTWSKMLSKFDKSSKEQWEIVNTSYKHILNNERGDLLSICILPEYRGAGVSGNLMSAFLDVMKSKGKKLCLLSVLSENDRAISYYEKNGFILYGTRGEIGRTYMKLL